jgi:NAD(P)-dependent dehydrogenase (short-subunit alcohol dehydrogenase family)
LSFSTLPLDANVVIAGASGGIGAALLQHCIADERVGKVFALYRSDAPDLSPKVEPIRFDLLDEDSIRIASEAVAENGPVDLAIVATGLLHSERLAPEKTLNDIDPELMLEAFQVNSVGPILFAKHFLPLMRRESKSVFAAISARVGSISDNRLGGWASYRASKAALNMLLRTAAIEHKRRRPESIVVALHPGTVDTGLSAPFQRGVPEGKLFTPAFSAERLVSVIDSLSADDTGHLFAWDGKPIDF